MMQHIPPITPDSKLLTFKNIITYILQQDDYKHLFNEQDREYLREYDECSEKAQLLYVNLYLRKHRWVRVKNMDYKYIAMDLTPYLKELKRAKFLETSDKVDDFVEVLNMMEKDELTTLVYKLKVVDVKKKSYASKSEMVQALRKHAERVSVLKHFASAKVNPVQMAVLREAKKIVGDSAYRLANEVWELFSRLTYLYYPPQVNEDEQGQVLAYDFFITEKMNSSGASRFVPYQIRRKRVIYQSREDLIQYEKACRLESKIMSSIQKSDWAKTESLYTQAQTGYLAFKDSPSYSHVQSLPIFLRNATAGHVYLRCLCHLIEAFEKQKNYQEAVKLCRVLVKQNVLCLSYKGKFYERLAIDLERHLRKPNDAFACLIDALNDEDVKEHFRYALYLKAKKLFNSCRGVNWNPCGDDKKYNHSFRSVDIIAPALRKGIPGKRNVFLNQYDTGTCSVETAALHHYKTKEGFADGIHSESSVFHTLFTLLIWDQIYFDQLDDVFRANHQKLPLDFVSEDFYNQREQMIEARLTQLQEMPKEQVSKEITASYAAHYGISSMVHWHLDKDRLKEIAYCIGMKPLADIFRRMCRNFRCNRSGFPDLIVWSAVDQRIRLVEVKGPGDSLSTKQIMWLHFFTSLQVDCEVAYVKPQK